MKPIKYTCLWCRKNRQTVFEKKAKTATCGKCKERPDCNQIKLV
jgi:ribosomal protein S27E